MSIVTILKKVLQIGAQTVPSILGMVNPALGAVVTTVVNAVLKAEGSIGSGKGAEKAVAAMDMLDTAAPALVTMIELQTGKELADQELFQQGLAQMQEGVVKVLNAFRVLPKTTVAAGN